MHVNSIEKEEATRKYTKESIYPVVRCKGAHLNMKMITDLVTMQPILMLIVMGSRSS